MSRVEVLDRKHASVLGKVYGFIKSRKGELSTANVAVGHIAAQVQRGKGLKEGPAGMRAQTLLDLRMQDRVPQS
ncbi:hypothetical protein AO354_43790, partial [Pseudomonas syringae pv. syringae]